MARGRGIAAAAIGRFRHTPDLANYVKDLQDRYYARGHWAIWCARDGFFGLTTWGYLNEGDAWGMRGAIEAVLDADPHRRFPQRTSLFDASAVVAVEPKAFEIMGEHFQRHGERYRGRLTRQAMLRPSGITGSVFAGFFDVAPPPFETAVFVSAPGAVAWLGTRERGLVAQVDRLRDVLSKTNPELMTLRRVLAANLTGVTLASAARLMGLSARTLQRRLQAAGTTFQAQWNTAQVAAAQLTLTQTQDKVGAIARAVGCSSEAQLSVLFRRLTGETPSDFRARTQRELGAPAR